MLDDSSVFNIESLDYRKVPNRDKISEVLYSIGDCNLFHGSNLEVREPRIIKSPKTKDFGDGFYLTKFENQARDWAFRCSRFKGAPIISKFNFTYPSDLKVKVFKKCDNEWLDFIVACRTNKPHEYDIVEGPMADDTVYSRVSEYIRGKLTRDQFFYICNFRYITHQYCFCTERSLRYLKFLESYKVVE